jgi:hypothetical protein
LIGLFQQVKEVPNNSAVATVEKGGCNTGVSGTTGTTDAVNIVIDVARKIVIDDVSNIRNVKTNVELAVLQKM